MRGHSERNGLTDRVLDALAHPKRRLLLFALFDEPEGSELRYDALPELDDERAQRALYHVHLPKLEQYGYVDWDRNDWTVTHGPQWTDVEPLLTLVDTYLNDLPPRLRGTSPDQTGTRG